MTENYKEYLDDALFTKNMTVTYKMLSFKEKISNVIAQQVLEAYMKEHSERVCGLYLTKPSDSTFALKTSDEINAESSASSEAQHICHIYSITSKTVKEEESGTEKSICEKTWESDKTHVFAPLLTAKSVGNVAENPLLSSSFSSIVPPTEEEIKLKLRPIYPHDPAPMHITKTSSTPIVKIEKNQSVETHITKSKTSDLGSLFTKNPSKNTVKKTSTNQLSFGSLSSSSSSSSSSSLTASTVSAVSSSSSVSSKTSKTSSSTTTSANTSHKPKLKRLRKQIDDDSDDDNGGNEEEEELEEDDDDGFFDDVIDNNDNGFLDDGNDDDILLPVKHENSNQEVKNPVQESRPAPVVHRPAPQQPPKKKPAAPKKKSGSGGTQTSIASFFCAKK